MNSYLSDIHIHTVLSPCGDLEMSPVNIVDEAVRKGLDIIAITDHNHTGNAQVTRKIGEERGLWVVYGSELTSKEEVHCLIYFDSDEQISEFQSFIDRYQMKIDDDRSFFGKQYIVDKEERILREIGYSLYPGLDRSLNEIACYTHELGGLFVPAHVNKRINGIYSQLGFLPMDLEVDALEIFRMTSEENIKNEYPELRDVQLLKNSDAHYLNEIGRNCSILKMKKRTFSEFKMAIRGHNGRGITLG